MEDRSRLEHHLIDIAREYAVKMNEIENQIFELAEADRVEGNNYFDEYSKQYQPVFLQYATRKSGSMAARQTALAGPPVTTASPAQRPDTLH